MWPHQKISCKHLKTACCTMEDKCCKCFCYNYYFFRKNMDGFPFFLIKRKVNSSGKCQILITFALNLSSIDIT